MKVVLVGTDVIELAVISPITVTVAVAVDELPFTSVTVKVTVLAPIEEQSNVVLSRTTEAIPQLSDEPLLICVAVIVAEPFTKSTEMF